MSKECPRAQTKRRSSRLSARRQSRTVQRRLTHGSSFETKRFSEQRLAAAAHGAWENPRSLISLQSTCAQAPHAPSGPLRGADRVRARVGAALSDRHVAAGGQAAHVPRVARMGGGVAQHDRLRIRQSLVASGDGAARHRRAVRRRVSRLSHHSDLPAAVSRRAVRAARSARRRRTPHGSCDRLSLRPRGRDASAAAGNGEGADGGRGAR